MSRTLPKISARQKGALRRTLTFAATVLALGAFGESSAANNDAAAHASRARDFTLGLDYDEARKELALGDAGDPAILLEAGRLALYEADCDAALVTLARADVAKTDDGAALADVARGCVRVTAANVVDKDEARAVEIRYQDEFDRAMTPLIVETVVKARDALTRDLGVTWPKPTRITVVRDLLSLSAMTGLSKKAAQTTGTVAVAKWGRVTLLSPRASNHGYPWRDTVAHELTHLAVTRATMDRAPLWLQEGVAKRQEVRWRDPNSFDDRPSADAMVLRGVELHLDIPLDKLGPSIAMLPTIDGAVVAFAEVTSFVRYFVGAAQTDALPRLFRALRENKGVDAALAETSGADLKAWDARWRAYLAGKPHEPVPALFGLGTQLPNLRDLRERVRLGELLLGRGHAPEAVRELDKVKAPSVLEDASLRYFRARALEAAGRAAEGAPLVASPKDVVSSYGPWWAIRGRWARARGDEATADSSFVEAVSDDPLDVECACQGIDPSSRPADPALNALCDAARARGEPPIGRE